MNHDIEVVITDPALVPDELCDVTVTMSAQQYARLCCAIDFSKPKWAEPSMRTGQRVPANERIREAMGKPCPKCGGEGVCCVVSGQQPSICGCGLPHDKDKQRFVCPECNGTKTASVPGTRLEPRSESVVVK
jgi:hypothetical protein